MADAEHAVAQIWRILEEHRIASPQMTVAVVQSRDRVDLSLTFGTAHDAGLMGRALAASGLPPAAELETAMLTPAAEQRGREAVMTDYRCYLLGLSGSIQSAYDITCENDEFALATARGLFQPHAFEVWQRQRRIYLLVETCCRDGDPDLEEARGRGLKAEEYHTVADQMTNPVAQASFRRLTETYDLTAEQYEPTPRAEMSEKAQKS